MKIRNGARQTTFNSCAQCGTPIFHAGSPQVTGKVPSEPATILSPGCRLFDAQLARTRTAQVRDFVDHAAGRGSEGLDVFAAWDPSFRAMLQQVTAAQTVLARVAQPRTSQARLTAFQNGPTAIWPNRPKTVHRAFPATLVPDTNFGQLYSGLPLEIVSSSRNVSKTSVLETLVSG